MILWLLSSTQCRKPFVGALLIPSCFRCSGGLGGTLNSLRGGCDTGVSSCSSRDAKLCCLIASYSGGFRENRHLSSKSLGGG